MTLREMGFSLEDEVPRLEERRDELGEERERIKSEAKSLQEKDELTGRDKKKFKSLKKEWKEVEAERSQVTAKIERFSQYVDEWSDTEFRVRELSFGEVQNIKDIVSSESFDVDVELQSIEGTPLQGLYQTEVLERAVVSMPEDGPDNPNDLPDVLGEWVMEKVESINSLGDDDMGNMSLEQAINSES